MTLTRITSDGITDATIATADLADQSVTLAKLPHGTSSNDGKFLRANNGADPTFESVITDLVNDTSPQLGGDLDSNGHHIVITDGEELRLGNDHDTKIKFNGSKSQIVSSVQFDIDADIIDIHNAAQNATKARFLNNQVELYYNNSKKLETKSWGCEVTGQLHATGSVKVEDNAEIQIGNGADLKIYHNGTNSYITDSGTGALRINSNDARILNAAGTEDMIRCQENGAVELYYDNYKAYVTNGGGGASNGMLSADSVLNLNTSQDGSGSDYFVRGSKNSTAVGAGSDVFWIYEDGDMYNVNGTFSQSSDIKLKENIVDASSQWSDIKALKVRKFNFKASTGYGTHTQIGMVAQEVETTCPGLITERVDLQKTENSDKTWTETDTGEKTKSIKLTVLYMKAVKALQEAMTRIETLETEVAALKAG